MCPPSLLTVQHLYCRNLYVLGHLLQYGLAAVEVNAAPDGTFLSTDTVLEVFILLFQSTGGGAPGLLRSAALAAVHRLETAYLYKGPSSLHPVQDATDKSVVQHEAEAQAPQQALCLQSMHRLML